MWNYIVLKCVQHCSTICSTSVPPLAKVYIQMSWFSSINLVSWHLWGPKKNSLWTLTKSHSHQHPFIPSPHHISAIFSFLAIPEADTSCFEKKRQICFHGEWGESSGEFMGDRSKNWWSKTIENGTFNRRIIYLWIYDLIWYHMTNRIWPTVVSLGLFKTGG